MLIPVCQKENQCDMKRPSTGSVFLEPSLIVAIIQSDNLLFAITTFGHFFFECKLSRNTSTSWAGLGPNLE